MFGRESEMAEAVARWMRNAGLLVRAEFVTPWGICDLVGARLNAVNVARRLDLRQNRAIGSITRALVLLQIPDVKSKRSISLERLRERVGTGIDSNVLHDDVERLVADRFVVRTARGSLRKLNGWLPLQDRLVAVELKLSRVEEAMVQARSNLGFADESYVAFPAEQAKRIAANRDRWSTYFAAGVGLLAVTPKSCRVLIPATPSAAKQPAIQAYCVDKFWKHHRQLSISGSTTASGRRAVPSSPDKVGKPLPRA